jgi:hypothetical protein
MSAATDNNIVNIIILPPAVIHVGQWGDSHIINQSRFILLLNTIYVLYIDLIYYLYLFLWAQEHIARMTNHSKRGPFAARILLHLDYVAALTFNII